MTRRIGMLLVTTAVAVWVAWPTGCATTTHTRVEVYERTDDPALDEVAEDEGEVVHEESGEYEMVPPGKMIVDD